MHILDYLKDAEQNIQVDEHSVAHFEPRLGKDSVRVEYRLICSGMFYPAGFLADWSHSDVARILLSLPVELLVASHPYDSYPQELVLRFVVPLVQETDGKVSSLYHPDQEIASDLAALITLLCRRLVTVAVKAREQYHDPRIPPILADCPIAAATTARLSYWARRPMHFLYGLEGVQVQSYHPPPQPFDSGGIIGILLALPKSPIAPAILRAARLYALAMELIESQAETCYQLFISAVETMAGAVLEGWEPDTESKVAAKGGLVSYAMKKERLCREAAERLALEASRGNPWSSRKFKKFLLDNLNREAIRTEDKLFIVPQEFCPKDDAEIERTLGEVYRIRSGVTHSGLPYPDSAPIGPSPTAPFKAWSALFTKEHPFPPIGWFERVVNNAICNYLRRELGDASDAKRGGVTEHDDRGEPSA